jgi:hypothetical protein
VPSASEVHHDARAAQACRPRRHVAVLDMDFRTHRLEALHVLVDRALANGAAARQRDPRLAAAREQRAEHEYRGAHGPHELVRRARVGDTLRVQLERTRGRRAQADAHAFE